MTGDAHFDAVKSGLKLMTQGQRDYTLSVSRIDDLRAVLFYCYTLLERTLPEDSRKERLKANIDAAIFDTPAKRQWPNQYAFERPVSKNDRELLGILKTFVREHQDHQEEG